MPRSRPHKAITRALTLGLGLGWHAHVHAQVNPNDANLSTGSGAGTSPGTAPGSSPSSTRIGNSNLRPDDGPQDAPGQKPIVNLNTGLPYAIDPDSIATLSQEELKEIDKELLANANAITRPEDRAMAFERVARAKIFSHRLGDNRLDEAHEAVVEGGKAARAVQDPLTRDIRLMNLVRTGLLLSDEFIRDSLINTTDLSDGPIKSEWSPRKRLDFLIRAENERNTASQLAFRIDSSNLRSELLYEVVNNESQASQIVAQAALVTDGRRSDLRGQEDMFNRMADRSLVIAANTSAKILKPIWRDRSMVSIAVAAAASEQFERGTQISRTIPQPEYRSDALIRLAESEARRNFPSQATVTYAEAAEAVACIPLEDPRAILASVLIDSLISVGRFEDARACVPFYPDNVRRLNALGTIAESQGERRLAESALAWIERDAPASIRDQLRLRVNEGQLKAFEKGRRADASQGDGAGSR